MTSSIKQLFRLFILTACLFCFSMPQLFASANDNPSIISVDGSGVVYGTPDTATLSIGVTTSSKDSTEAQNSNASKSSAVQNAIKALGISEKDITTRNYSFRPTYTRDNSGKSKLSGYEVNNSISVKIKDLSKTGTVIDTALNNGATRVNSLDFSISNTKNLRKQALSQAVEDARDKAEIIASGLGKHIIGVKNVTESVSPFNYHHYNTMFSAKALSSDGNASTPIESGELSLTATVHVDFIINN